MQFTIPVIKNKKIRFGLKEDQVILLVCIGIALVFWLLVKLSQSYPTERTVVLSFNIPADKTFTLAPPDDMIVQLEGTGWDLIFDFFSNPRVNLSYDMSGSDFLNLNRGQLRTDILNQLSGSDLKITEVNYDNINLSLEEKVSKKVPVRLNAAFSFASEYHLGQKVSLEPDSILVSGPLSLVESILEWETDSLVLNNLRTSQVAFLTLPNAKREIELFPQTIKAVVTVEQFTERSIFVPLTVLNAPDSVKIFPGNVKVTCVVGLSQYNGLSADSFQLVLDLQDVPVSEAKNTAPISLVKYPSFVKRINFSPQSAEFFFLK